MEKIAKTGNFLILLPFGLIYFFQTMRFLMFFLPKGLFSTLIALSISIFVECFISHGIPGPPCAYCTGQVGLPGIGGISVVGISLEH